MKLRAAAVSFLNARPLTAGLAGSPLIDLVLAEPSLCASMLEAGDVDLALLPVGALPGRDWEVVPGIGIGADGPVQTVVLAGEEPPERVGRGLPRHRLAHLADPGPAGDARARPLAPLHAHARARGAGPRRRARRGRWSSATGPST